LDFGLAKFRAGAMREESETQTGVLVGTLAYMAPERFRGDPVHPSWDIWSLAVIAYEMLTGQRPFRAETQSGVQRALLAGRFDAVSRHVSSAPPGLQAFFERSLSLESTDRPVSARQFFEQLEQAFSAPPAT
ncbi:MAG: protein kinase, partial [Acidobacteria bacterium]|nr:protein kinase [Acidobacteriota bacterium]